MLTKNDLQQIRTVVAEEVEEKLSPIKKDISTMTKQLNQTSKDLSYVIKSYDARISHNENDIHHIKQHIGIA